MKKILGLVVLLGTSTAVVVPAMAHDRDDRYEARAYVSRANDACASYAAGYVTTYDSPYTHRRDERLDRKANWRHTDQRFGDRGDRSYDGNRR